MCHTHARLGRGLVHARHGIVDGLDAVGHVVHLAAAAHLQANRRTHHVGVVLPHVHDHGTTPGRRCGDQAHVAHAARGHLHGSRNRRCREREHVDLLAQVFELLLVLHTKALLFVDDHHAQVLGVHIGRKQAVRADEHINRALGKRLERALLLRRGAEAAEHLDLQAKRGKALKECLVVLLGQNGRGAEHHDLTAGVHALKGRAQGDLGLAETHVAAQQAVHGLGRLHVGLDVGDSLQLVTRLVVGEALLHLDLLGRIGRTGDTGNRRATRIQVDQVKRQLFGILARLVGGPRPVGGVEPGQARFIAVGTNVARDTVDLLERHVELVAIGIFQQKVVAFLAAHFLARDLAKERDAVGSVHHVVSRLKREGDLRNVDLAAAARAVGIHAGVEVSDREHGQIGVGHHHALWQGSVDKGHAPARDGGHGGAGGSLRGARLERAGVERVGLTLANGSMGLLACGTVGGIRRCHAHAVADSAGIFGRRGQRFLKGNALVAKGELHRLARTAVGDGKHAGIALAHDLLDARHKTVVRACDGRLLNLELGRHRTAGTDEAHIVQALLGTKVELLGTHVQAVQTVDPRLAGTCLDILVGAQAIVEQRARLGQHHERLAAHVRQRAHGLAVHHRQKAVELRRDDARIHHLEQRRQLAVVLTGAVERHMHVVDGLVSKRQLATGEDLDAVLVADGLARGTHHAAYAVDLVAEKLNAYGRLFLRGKHLDGVAVHTEQAGRVGGAGIGVAHAHQTLRHLVKGNLLAHRKSSGLPVVALDRRHAAQQCAGRGDHDAVVAAHDAPERLAALGYHGVVGRLLAPRVVLALGKAAHVRQAHVGGQTACGTIGRILATHNVDRGARTTRELGGRHKCSARLRHGQRHVLARIEPGLDGLQRLGGVELRGYTVNEHAVPPALQRQKPAEASSAGRSSNSLPVMVAHGEDSSSSVRPAPQKTPDRTGLIGFAKISPSLRTPQPRKVPQETAIPQKSSQRSSGSSTRLWCWQSRRVCTRPRNDRDTGTGLPY